MGSSLSRIKAPEDSETWKALLNVGVLLPLHIVLGVLSVPSALYYLMKRNRIAWALVLLYAPFYLWPAQRRYPGWRGFESFWRFMDYEHTCKSYFGQWDVHNTERIDAATQYFIACHPHGTITFQRMFWRSPMLEDCFSRPWRMLAASIVFRIPIVRELSLWAGAVDAARSNCERMLRAGVNVVVWPGGLDEASLPDAADEVRLRTRTGFIRLAVKHGTPVLPIFVFGELEAVRNVSPFPDQVARFLRKRFHMSTNVFLGRWLLLPFRVPFNLCVGHPVSVTQRRDEDAEFHAEVHRVHAAYKAELRALYESNKDRFGYAQRELVFVREPAEDVVTPAS